MARIDELFHYLKEHKGSDLHLAAGLEPRIRVHGSLAPVPGWPVLSHFDLLDLLREIASDAQWAEYTGCGDLDFAYGLEGLPASAPTTCARRTAAAPSSASSRRRSCRWRSSSSPRRSTPSPISSRGSC